MSKTRVSVIMPVYNAEKYLSEAIESILNQSYSDFEFLIQDDGSSDRSKYIIQKYASKDSRIIPIYSVKNQGITETLNSLIKNASGEYVARMDSDDVSLPNRIEKQIKFLDSNREIAIVGSSTIIIDEDGSEIGKSIEHSSSAFLFWKSFFRCPLIHPSVTVRREVVVESGFYDPKMTFAEDYDLWTKVMTLHKVSNIEEQLLKYRFHQISISNTNKDTQRNTSIDIIRGVWKKTFNLELDYDIAFFFENFHRSWDHLNPTYALRSAKLLSKLYRLVKNKFKVEDEEIKNDFFRKVLYLFLICRRHSISKSLLILWILIRYNLPALSKLTISKI